MMINDRKITISAGASRKAARWTPQVLMLSELWDRLRTPARGAETQAEYLALKKPQQDELKDVGGFVAGSLKGTRRKGSAVSGRDLLTLDLDHIPAGGTQDVLRRVDGLGCGYCIYSTRKHSPGAPRLRVLFPLDRTCTADEYEPLARRMAACTGIELADPSTFEASRLMYWPSCCADAEYIFTFADKPLLSADGLLAQYRDWRDITEWPQVPGTQQAQQRLAARQGDPTTKPGVVGAFCRVYNVYRAMDELLPGMYEPVDGSPDRYTFTGGSTTGGAVVYDGGSFLYSHHATDPAGGKLCNAFDLVRLHKFGDRDDDAQPGTPTNRLPSYAAMCELAVSDAGVAALINRERYEDAVREFDGVGADNTGDAANWMARLECNSEGKPLKTTDNLLLILENDPLLRGRIALDAFANKGVVLGAFPWDPREGRRPWTDNDDAGIRWYMEKTHKIAAKDKVSDALSLCGQNHAFDDVQDYLRGLSWDGTSRLDTLFVDYLGAEDSPYMRAITRKAFVAAVARAMTPGVKVDVMTVLTGRQGIGKSTLLRYMGHGWFTDSLRTFEGKEAAELIQGVWIVEISELQAFKGADVDRIKQVLSQCTDRFRAAYGKHVRDCPRRCIFFGSSNNREYLRDKTGNRRFWAVDTGVVSPTKSVWDDLPGEVDQIWGEAVLRWRLGEPLWLDSSMEREANLRREEHREYSPREGLIREFVERQVPRDWSRWDPPRRAAFWAGSATGELDLVERDRICAQEIWVEALGGDIRYMRYSDSAEINGILEMLPEWERYPKAQRFGCYGAQKGFKKV